MLNDGLIIKNMDLSHTHLAVFCRCSAFPAFFPRNFEIHLAQLLNCHFYETNKLSGTIMKSN